MKNTNKCPKCNSDDILNIAENRFAGGASNNIWLGSFLFNAVKVDRYLCTNCGYSDGRFVSVHFVKIQTNTINLPVIYRFEDQKVPEEDFIYVLLRIVPESREFEILKRWEYCYAKNEICPMEYLAIKYSY